jgi:predicted AlkP superfamily pyrophosphatase or phosphodiesterase
MRRAFLVGLASTLLVAPSLWCGAQQIAPVVTVDHAENTPRQRSKPYVVLVSFDGFRYDYAERYGAKNILALASQGATAPDGMIPSYPSLTFPNHYTIVTGLYPEHHGIVGNSFYDPARKQAYDSHDARTVTDGSWYGGTPLWVLAEQQGMRSASFFWIGSEAEIQGVRPSYYLRFDRTIANESRVQQVLAWLDLPPEQRPHFITLYFSDTDDAGHQYGPDSPQVAAAVHELDREIGNLMSGIERLKLRVDLFLVSDHGMTATRDGALDLDRYGLDPNALLRSTGQSLYAKSEADAQKLYDDLRDKSDKFVVYRRIQVPAHLHFDSNPREGDPVVVASGPFVIRVGGTTQTPNRTQVGSHGYDPASIPEMKAIFCAAGPDIRPRTRLASFENVDLYPVIAKILGLDITHLQSGPIDGKLSVLQSMLRSSN